MDRVEFPLGKLCKMNILQTLDTRGSCMIRYQCRSMPSVNSRHFLSLCYPCWFRSLPRLLRSSVVAPVRAIHLRGERDV